MFSSLKCVRRSVRLRAEEGEWRMPTQGEERVAPLLLQPKPAQHLDQDWSRLRAASELQSFGSPVEILERN